LRRFALAVTLLGLTVSLTAAEKRSTAKKDDLPDRAPVMIVFTNGGWPRSAEKCRAARRCNGVWLYNAQPFATWREW